MYLVIIMKKKLNGRKEQDVERRWRRLVPARFLATKTD